MENNQTLTTPKKIEKRLKRKQFDLFDAGYATLCFIILQIVFIMVLRALNLNLVPFNFEYCIASFLIEAVFVLASITVALSRNVEYFNATTFNKKIDWKTALLAVAISLICIFGFSSLTNCFVSSLELLGYKSALSSYEINNFGTYILNVFLTCLVPALFEEACFRGTILRGMLQERSKKYAIFMSALLFMLMHGGPDQTIHQFILGVILGYVLVYTGSIWATVLIHFLNNFYAVTALYISSIIQSAESGNIEVLEPATTTTWATVAQDLILGLAFGALAGYLIYLCIKGMAKVRKENKEVADRKFKDLLDKEELTPKEIKWIKSYKRQYGDFEDYTKEALEAKAKLASNSETVMSAEGENVDTESKTAKPKKQKSTLHIFYIIMLVASICYMSFEWILTLISGFLG